MKPLLLDGPETPGYIVYGLPRCFQVKASLWFNRRRSTPVFYGFFPGTEPDYVADPYAQHRLTASDLGIRTGRSA